MPRITRVFATAEQTHNLAVWLHNTVGLKAGQAKEWLAPKNYKIRGVNFKYTDVDKELLTLEATTNSVQTLTELIQNKEITNFRQVKAYLGI